MARNIVVAFARGSQLWNRMDVCLVANLIVSLILFPLLKTDKLNVIYERPEDSTEKTCPDEKLKPRVIFIIALTKDTAVGPSNIPATDEFSLLRLFVPLNSFKHYKFFHFDNESVTEMLPKGRPSSLPKLILHDHLTLRKGSARLDSANPPPLATNMTSTQSSSTESSTSKKTKTTDGSSSTKSNGFKNFTTTISSTSSQHVTEIDPSGDTEPYTTSNTKTEETTRASLKDTSTTPTTILTNDANCMCDLLTEITESIKKEKSSAATVIILWEIESIVCPFRVADCGVQMLKKIERDLYMYRKRRVLIQKLEPHYSNPPISGCLPPRPICYQIRECDSEGEEGDSCPADCPIQEFFDRDLDEEGLDTDHKCRIQPNCSATSTSPATKTATESVVSRQVIHT